MKDRSTEIIQSEQQKKKKRRLKKKSWAWRQWLTPVVLATTKR
jgi:hypothetical protein